MDLRQGDHKGKMLLPSHQGYILSTQIMTVGVDPGHSVDIGLSCFFTLLPI